jgi:hypothetical protein
MKSRNLSVLSLSQKTLSQTSSVWRAIATKLAQLQTFFVHITKTSQDLEVTWRCNLHGQAYIEIYDPSTEKHHRFDSEQDAMIWLDRDRYRQTATQEKELVKELRRLNSYK